MTRAQMLHRWRREMNLAEADLLRDGFLAPSIVVIGRDGAESALAPDLRDEAAVSRSANMARLLAVSLDAVLVVVRAETWVVAGAGLPAGVSPASSDRRVEAVLVAASGHINMGGQARTERLLSLREIVRGADARPSGLRERPLPKTTHHEGWMTDVLPPRRPTASEQELAAMLLKVMVERA